MKMLSHLSPPPNFASEGIKAGYLLSACYFSGKALDFPSPPPSTPVACNLPASQPPRPLQGQGQPEKVGDWTSSSQHGCQTCLLSALAPGAPVLKGPAEWAFRRPLRGGNKCHRRMPAAHCPHFCRPGRGALGGLQAGFQRRLDSISQSLKLSGRWAGVGLVAGGRNWLDGRVRNPHPTPRHRFLGLDPAPCGEAGGWPRGSAPCPGLSSR